MEIDLERLVKLNDGDHDGKIDQRGIVSHRIFGTLSNMHAEFTNAVAEFLVIARSLKQRQLSDLIATRSAKGVKTARADYEWAMDHRPHFTIPLLGWKPIILNDGSTIFAHSLIGEIIRTTKRTDLPLKSFSMMAHVSTRYCTPLLEQASEHWSSAWGSLPPERAHLYKRSIEQVNATALRFTMFENQDAAERLSDLDTVSGCYDFPKTHQQKFAIVINYSIATGSNTSFYLLVQAATASVRY